MKHIGIDLQTEECFSHWQLYVALSKGTSQHNLHVIGPRTNDYCTDGLLTNVVWKQVLLPAGEGNSGAACRADF